MDYALFYRRAVWCTLFFFFAMCAFAQQLTVKGVVTDSKGETVMVHLFLWKVRLMVL